MRPPLRSDDPGDRSLPTNAASSRGKGRALGEVPGLGTRETHASVDGPAGTLEDRTKIAPAQFAESDDEHRHALRCGSVYSATGNSTLAFRAALRLESLVWASC